MNKDQQNAVQVLYAAAARLLHSAGTFTINEKDEASRDLNRNSVDNCIKLAEYIASMTAIKVLCDTPTSVEINSTPFNIGFQAEVEPLDDEKLR